MAVNCMYRFLHDRVQQAAYSLIPEEERSETHLRIGRLLWSHTKPEKLEEDVYTVVNQINMGYKLVKEPEERWKVALLNYIAGKKASAATAYLAAVKYLDISIFLLMGDIYAEGGEASASPAVDRNSVRFQEEKREDEMVDCWDEHRRKQTMDILVEATVAHYLNIDFAGAGKLCEVRKREKEGPVGGGEEGK